MTEQQAKMARVRAQRKPRDPDALTAREVAFVAAYVYGDGTRGNKTAAMKAAGYAPASAGVTAHELLEKPRVAVAVAAAQAERTARIEAEGVASLEYRVRVYNEIETAQREILTERGADPATAQAPGGKTGYIQRRVTRVPNPLVGQRGQPATVPVIEDNYDGGMVAARLANLKQAAQDLGQWKDRQSLELSDDRLAGEVRKLAKAQGLSDEEAERAVAHTLKIAAGKAAS